LTTGETRRWEMISRYTVGILYVFSGNRNSPIEVQKKLGLLQAHNRMRLLAWLARLMARAFSLGVYTSGSKGQLPVC